MFPQDVLPQTVEAWVFLIAACAIGLFVGQWISHHRKKQDADKAAYAKRVSTGQKKRVSKKERLKSRRSLNS
jgi:hypothetical protein